MKQLQKIQAICQKDVRYDKNTKTYMYWNWSIYMNHINIISMAKKGNNKNRTVCIDIYHNVMKTGYKLFVDNIVEKL